LLILLDLYDFLILKIIQNYEKFFKLSIKINPKTS